MWPLSLYLFICIELLFRRIHHKVDLLNWNTINISIGGPKISHLFFVDDLTLFTKTNNKNSKTIRRTIATFSFFSGQKINVAKSKVIFSKNCSTDTSITLVNMLNSQPKNLPNFLYGPYLWGFLVHSWWFESKLCGWNKKFLNMVGRTNFSKASLNNIPNHIM